MRPKFNPFSTCKDKKFLWLLFTALTVGIFECLALSGLRLPPPIERPFFLAFILLSGSSILWEGAKALLFLRFGSLHPLMLIAVAGAWYLGKYEEAAVVIALYALAEKLEETGLEKSRSSMETLLKGMPASAWLSRQQCQVPVERVAVGDLIGVKPYEKIPLDGVISSGLSCIDESTITGESLPQEKMAGDRVYAGTWNKQGYLEVEVLHPSNESALAKIRELTLQAMQRKAPIQRFIERFSLYYTPAVILTALFWVLIPYGFLGFPLASQLNTGLALLVIACPCALVISSPVAIYSALGNASRQGALLKGGDALEAVGRIRAVALDKTGTLTYGRPTVSDVIPCGALSKRQLLECAAGIELFSEHPLAQSIVEAARRENGALHPVENFKSLAGKGVQADCLVCSEPHHCLGKLPFILEEHTVPKEVVDRVEALQEEGKTPILIATHQNVEGILAMSDELRPESRRLIEELDALGIASILLTGDHWPAARQAADRLGIGSVQAELLPEEKAHAIEQLLQSHGEVAMTGDGVNDAPALALSTVGITLGSIGSDAALEAASIVILHDRIALLPCLIRLGRQTTRLIRLNTGFALGVKLLFVTLALMGMSNLALAIFADTGVTFLVILSSLRLRNWGS